MHGHPGPKRAAAAPLGRRLPHRARERFGAATSHPTPYPTSPTASDFAPAPGAMESQSRRGGTTVIDPSDPAHDSPQALSHGRPSSAGGTIARNRARADHNAAADLPARLGVRRDAGAEDGAAAGLRRSRSAAALRCEVQASHEPRERQDSTTQSRRGWKRATAAGGARTGIRADRSNSAHVALVRGNGLNVGASGTSEGRYGRRVAGRLFNRIQRVETLLTNEPMRVRRPSWGRVSTRRHRRDASSVQPRLSWDAVHCFSLFLPIGTGKRGIW